VKFFFVEEKKRSIEWGRNMREKRKGRFERRRGFIEKIIEREKVAK